MKLKTVKIVLSLGVFALSATARAQSTIDTTSFWNGNNFISAWGSGATATYGQTFTPTATQSDLTSMTFFIDAANTSPYNFEAYVYQWSGGNITGGPLFTSSAIAAPTSVGTFVNVSVATGGVSLTPGSQYVAFYSANGLGNAAGGSALWGYLGTSAQNGADDYTGGNFVFNNNTDTTFSGGWQNPTYYAGQATHDLAFTLNFAPVPEPTTLTLAGLAGAASLLRFRRK